MAGRGWSAKTKHGLDEGGWWDILGKENGKEDARWMQDAKIGIVNRRFALHVCTPYVCTYVRRTYLCCGCVANDATVGTTGVRDTQYYGNSSVEYVLAGVNLHICLT